MEWPLPLAVSLQSLLLDCKFFISLSSSQELVALKYFVYSWSFQFLKDCEKECSSVFGGAVNPPLVGLMYYECKAWLQICDA